MIDLIKLNEDRSRAVNFGSAQQAGLMTQCFGLCWTEKIETQKEPCHFGIAHLNHAGLAFFMFFELFFLFFC